MYTLGIDIGSSSIKVSLFDVDSGKSIASAQYPDTELKIDAPQPGWAEQDPEMWWTSFLEAYKRLSSKEAIRPTEILAIGIAYQMHGLVTVDESGEVIRPSIIWCDSRAVEAGGMILQQLGEVYAHNMLLNSPGNFTAAKLKWIERHEPKSFERIHRFMLPGDYVAFRLTGEITTTASGLSEGIFWNFAQHSVSTEVLDAINGGAAMLPTTVDTFHDSLHVNSSVAKDLGLKSGIPVSYRAGDQPNNAFSLNVLNPGEVAATAGTSGVIYAVTDQNIGDVQSRINTFLHVNGTAEAKRNGVLLCINGTGILNSWLRKLAGSENTSYEQMNAEAARAPIGSEGLMLFPFGNGAERILQNRLLHGSMHGLDFNRHGRSHVFRAAQEGIVFALNYGFEVLKELGLPGKVIRAGHANMFLSSVFREAFVNTTGLPLELYNTDGAEGAARGAAIGAKLIDEKDLFKGLEIKEMIAPEQSKTEAYSENYGRWKLQLEKYLTQ